MDTETVEAVEAVEAVETVEAKPVYRLVFVESGEVGRMLSGAVVRVAEGCVGVDDGLGVYVVEDALENVLPLVVRSVLGGSLLPDWTEKGGGVVVMRWEDEVARDTKFDKQTRLVVWFAIIALVVGYLISHYTDGQDNVQDRCQEDMTCWDCETMGNRECGVE